MQGSTRLVDADDPLLANISVYAFLGLQHIVPLGMDHVLFVLGLFFVGGGVRQLLLLVSCFTLAHTLTLAASTLGVISLPQSVVEPLIAASIVYVGLEGLFDQLQAEGLDACKDGAERNDCSATAGCAGGDRVTVRRRSGPRATDAAVRFRC